MNLKQALPGVQVLLPLLQIIVVSGRSNTMAECCPLKKLLLYYGR